MRAGARPALGRATAIPGAAAQGYQELSAQEESAEELATLLQNWLQLEQERGDEASVSAVEVWPTPTYPLTPGCRVCEDLNSFVCVCVCVCGCGCVCFF